VADDSIPPARDSALDRLEADISTLRRQIAAAREDLQMLTVDLQAADAAAAEPTPERGDEPAAASTRPPGIDLHCHLLPGVDDGAQDMQTAVAMARAARAAGVGTIVATPHADATFAVGSARRDAVLAELREALAREGVDVEALPGAEIAISRFLELDDAERDALRLGGGPCWLLESPLEVSAGPFDDHVSELLQSGVRIVMAHPERCPSFIRDPDRLARLVAQGVLTSVTAGALGGRFGETVRGFACDMLRRGLVHSVASDAHNVVGRPPGLRADLEAIGLGDLVAQLTEVAPAAILAGRRPEPAEPPPGWSPPRRGGALRRLLGR
jgi:protein-tyrosine phosphatase